ncbi:MAG: NUDIX domain-containing protein [Candidatus Nezhaarchaeota archaeon]|nr:NUDIX domain-containing protein [Candidatus Nezhaarchaeota archaeon]
MVGVGVVVIDDDGRILLIKRLNPPDPGLWTIPGGLVELGEKVEEAAVREVEEETGVTVELRGLLDVVDKIVVDEQGRVKYHYVIIDFLGKPLNREIRASPEVQEAAWVELPKLSRGELPITDTLRGLLLKHGFI